MSSVIIPHRQRGISLIELMVGIAISLILLTGVISVVVRMSVAGGESVQGTRLNQQLRGTLDTMAKDLQRAGYVDWWHAWDDDDGDGNTLDANDGATQSALINSDGDADGNINVLDFYTSAVPAINQFGQVSLFTYDSGAGTQAACTSNCNCILFSYDLNEDGAQGVAAGAGIAQNTANRELFGYRLRNGAIETRIGGGGATNSCIDGSWEDITDSSVVEITALNFGLTYANAVGTGNDSTVYPITGITAGGISNACAPTDGDGDGVLGGLDDDKCLWRRKVDISIAGRLTTDTAVTLTLNTDVKIKNDYFQTQ